MSAHGLILVVRNVRIRGLIRMNRTYVGPFPLGILGFDRNSNQDLPKIQSVTGTQDLGALSTTLEKVTKTL